MKYKSLLLWIVLLISTSSAFAQLQVFTVSGTTSLGFNSNGGIAEITAYDRLTKQLYVINGITNQILVYDFNNPMVNPLPLITTLSFPSAGSINSIACYEGLLAIVYENLTDRTLNGAVRLLTTAGNTLIGSEITVGFQPDMITFTPDGRKLLVANEGEPNESYTIDPEGSVSIIDVSNPLSPVVSHVSFTSLNGTIPHLATQPSTMPPIRIFGMKNSLPTTDPNFAINNVKTPSTVAEDLEPEYITVSPDGNFAWVTCQENNAVVIINVQTQSLVTIVGLGYKNHNSPGNGLDASRNPTNPNGVDIRNWPFKGMYQPDGISVLSVGGIPYLFTANEGDARAYAGFNEELDMTAAFAISLSGSNPEFTAVGANTIASLQTRISNTMGNLNGGAPYLVNSLTGGANGFQINAGNNFEELYTFGTRSFSVWNGLTGQLVWDSGDQFERITFGRYPLNFNADHNGAAGNNVKRRSNTKGPEPESIVTGMVGDSLYAFVGLERIGGVMIYNVTNPAMPCFRDYINARNFTVPPTSAAAGDLGPEGLMFIKASESPDGRPYLVVSNEVSGTLRVLGFSYQRRIAFGAPQPFVIAANATESPVQTITLNGTNMGSSINIASQNPNFVLSTSAGGSFQPSWNLSIPGTLNNFPLFIKYIGSSIGSATSTIEFTVAGVQVAPVSLTGIKTTSVPGASAFTLQVLHASDFEAGLAALERAPKFVAMWNQFNSEYPNTLRVSGGDNFLPSPFFNAASDIQTRSLFATLSGQYLGGTGNTSNYREGIGRGDLMIMNLLDLHASAVGNHEFDAGTGTFAEIIGVNYNNPTNPTQVRWLGARFPYLSANLDFSGDANLAPLYTSEIRLSNSYRLNPTVSAVTTLTPAQRAKIAPATVATIGGEAVGIVGATTQIVSKISSTGGVVVRGTTVDDMPLLASQLQPVIDQLRSRGINKIVLLSHLQQISFEKTLAQLLSGVDIIVAAGSHTLMSDADDMLEGDTQQEVYPFKTTDKDGSNTLIVSTSSEYSYVGRLVIDFDANGNVIPSSYVTSISGAWKVSDLGLSRAMVNTVTAFSGTTTSNLTRGLIEGINNFALQPFAITVAGVTGTAPGIRTIINAQDGFIVGKTNVYIEGRREKVRLEETTLGNLSADANLAEARKFDPTVVISLKNGGGIRASIGVVSAVGSNFVNLPPLANPSAGKLSGDVSQLDVANSLRFNNGLSIGSVTASTLLQVINHGFAASAAGATPGQFPQLGGVEVSWDPSAPAGSRVRALAIVDENRRVIDVVAHNGLLVGDPNRTFKMVTLNFLVSNGGAGTVGGDAYPLNSVSFANRVDLSTATGFNTITGPALFGGIGSEQDAFAKYFMANYPRTGSGYNLTESGMSLDNRIQNLSARAEMILPDFSMPLATFTGILGTTAQLSGVSVSTQKLAAPVSIWAPANVSVNGTHMVTLSGMGGNIQVDVNLTATGTFVITLTSASLVKTFTHTVRAIQVPTATFTGGTLTFGGPSLDLSSLLSSTSTSMVKSFVVSSGTAASVSGTLLVPVAAGMVTVTGTVASTTGFTAVSAQAVFQVFAAPAMITFTGKTLTVGGSHLDLETVLQTNSTGVKSFSVLAGDAATLLGSNLVAVKPGQVTVSGMVASTTGYTAAMANAVFQVVRILSIGTGSDTLQVSPDRITIVVAKGTFTGTSLLTINGVNIAGNLLVKTPPFLSIALDTTGTSNTTAYSTTVPAGAFTVELTLLSTPQTNAGTLTGVVTVTAGTLTTYAFVTLVVTDSVSTSMPRVAAKNNLVVYPNPSSDGILYLNKVSSFEVYDLMGAVVYVAKNTQKVNLSHLPSGSYLLKTALGEIVKFRLK